MTDIEKKIADTQVEISRLKRDNSDIPHLFLRVMDNQIIMMQMLEKLLNSQNNPISENSQKQ